MKINEVITNKGTYAAVKFSKNTIENIAEYIKNNNIPNPLDTKKMHTTLLYSRKYLPNYEPKGKFDSVIIGKPTKFDVWESQPDDDDGNTNNCLVLEYDCPELNERHDYLMDKHKATYDYDEYKTHITFSYNITDFDIKTLPSVDFDIEIVSEYKEDLNISWASDNQ